MQHQSGTQVKINACCTQGPGLHEVLQPDLVVPLLQQPGMLEALAPHLPERHRFAVSQGAGGVKRITGVVLMGYCAKRA